MNQNKILEEKINDFRRQINYLDNKKKEINNLVTIYSEQLKKNKNKSRNWLNNTYR